MPQFDYADTVCYMCKLYLARIVQILQNRAARIISNNFDYKRIRGEHLINNLNLQTIKARQKYRNIS